MKRKVEFHSGMPKSLAWFCPLSHKHLLKGMFLSERVLPELLSCGYDVTVFVDDEDLQELGGSKHANSVSELKIFGNIPVKHYLRAFLEHKTKKFDFAVHNIEDHPRSAFCQLMLGFWPGVSLFHDLNLNQLMHSKVSHATTGIALDEQLAESFGGDVVGLGDFQARGWSIEIFDRFFPHGESEIKLAAALGVFSETIANRNYPKDSLFRFNYPFARDGNPACVKAEKIEKRSQLRQQLGIEAESLVLGYTGQRNLEDSPTEVWQAFEKARLSLPQDYKLHFLWVKEELIQSSAYFSAETRESQFFHTAEYNSCSDFADLMGGLDLLLHAGFDKLRGVPSALLQAAEQRLPVVCADVGALREYTFFKRVSPSANFSHTLAEGIVDILTKPELRSEIEQQTNNYISDLANSDRFIADLGEAFAFISESKLLESKFLEIQKLKEKLLTETLEKLPGLSNSAKAGLCVEVNTGLEG